MCLRRSCCFFLLFWLDFQNQKIQMLMSFYSRIFMDDFVPCLGSKPKTPLRSVGLSCSSSLFLVVQSRILVYTVMVFLEFLIIPACDPCRWPRCTDHRPVWLLILCLGNSTASITARRGRCSPSTHGVLLPTQTCLQNGKLAL